MPRPNERESTTRTAFQRVTPMTRKPIVSSTCTQRKRAQADSFRTSITTSMSPATSPTSATPPNRQSSSPMRAWSPGARYTYDSLFRLIEATGREHLGQAGGAPIPHSYNDGPRVGRVSIPHPNDGQALGRYIERYFYDQVGNFEAMRHAGSDPQHPGWTRTYAFNEPSQLEPGQVSNRLTSTTVGNGVTASEVYSIAGDGYDDHGNMLKMPQLQIMQWNERDQLQMTQRQSVNQTDADGVQRQGERTWYVYDAGGQRIRKVTELANSQVKDERLYLGGFEIYSRPADNLVRETLHVMDEKQRIALVEIRIWGIEPGNPRELVRYQLGNHLGSACLEVDDQARVLSYEEYTPYGSTAYQAVRSQIQAPKRYRFTGMERDEESGLSYHSARYYAPWLGRWTSADPEELVDGPNLYRYSRSSPVVYMDPNGNDPPDPQSFATREEYISSVQEPWDPAFLGELWNQTHSVSTQNASELSPRHAEIIAAAQQHPGETVELFGFSDVAAWQTDELFLHEFKSYTVHALREPIREAAEMFDLPAELVGGTAYNEIGGKDPIKSTVYWIRGWAPGTSDQDRTSLGPLALQVRRAAATLGYGPSNISDSQRSAIIATLNDPAQAVFLAAAHLSDLRNVDFPGTTASQLTDDQIRVIGARYNQGPQRPLSSVRQDSELWKHDRPAMASSHSSFVGPGQCAPSRMEPDRK